jgi:hypothetical protein
MREDKKKKRAEEKKAEEEKKKKSDQEKATASSVTISPTPSTNDTTVDSDRGMIIDIDEETTTQTDNWTRTASAPITFLEKKKPGKATDTGKEAPHETQTVNDTPSRALASPKQHINTITHTPTWKRPSPCRRKISQRNLSNGKILDPNFALASLKCDTATKKPKLITAEDDVPRSTLRTSGSTPAPREIGFLRREEGLERRQLIQKSRPLGQCNLGGYLR